MIFPAIKYFIAGKIIPQPQPSKGATYARKIAKEDGRIDWNEPARVLWNRVRAFTPWPGAFTFQQVDGKQRLLKIWSAEVTPEQRGKPGEVLSRDKTGIVVRAGTDALRITELQREGGR